MKVILFILLISLTAHADIPLPLKPSQEPAANFICFSREAARKVQECYTREKLYQKELSSENSSGGYIIGGIVGFIVGGLVISVLSH